MQMLTFNRILKVWGFLNAELAEKQFRGIAFMLFPIRCALNGKMCARELLFRPWPSGHKALYSHIGGFSQPSLPGCIMLIRAAHSGDLGCSM